MTHYHAILYYHSAVGYNSVDYITDKNITHHKIHFNNI